MSAYVGGGERRVGGREGRADDDHLHGKRRRGWMVGVHERVKVTRKGRGRGDRCCQQCVGPASSSCERGSQ